MNNAIIINGEIYELVANDTGISWECMSEEIMEIFKIRGTMTRRKTSKGCGGCKNFDMADTWRSTFHGVFCEGTCSITGKAIHNRHYACKDYRPCCVGNMTLIEV